MASDKREIALTVEEYREQLVPSYHSITMALMGRIQDRIRSHDFMVDKVISKTNLLDTRTVLPSMFNTEMTEVNHAKFYPVGESFAAVGMYLGFRVSQMQTTNRIANHNAINRETTIGWDRAALAGEWGNKGLLNVYNNDPFRIAMPSVSLPARTADFAARAKAVKDMASELASKIDDTTAAVAITVVVFGGLQKYMTDTNIATDATSLYDHLRKGFEGKYVTILSVPSMVLKGSSLENSVGLAVVADGMIGLDTVGLPDIDKVGTESSEAGDFDWSRFRVGSAQFFCDIKGAIINQPITIAS